MYNIVKNHLVPLTGYSILSEHCLFKILRNHRFTRTTTTTIYIFVRRVWQNGFLYYILIRFIYSLNYLFYKRLRFLCIFTVFTLWLNPACVYYIPTYYTDCTEFTTQNIPNRPSKTYQTSAPLAPYNNTNTWQKNYHIIERAYIYFHCI